ncbi:PREDICTED: patatin-like phospholipase domain-containing protein 3 [Gekko japonicus]|uniref:Patatin-like phospholipase domain-containing protein 3 n=1 Tax=Gekko japonicus TaxID=146911 RepID=A0ABM1L3S3_GEKJA|nr:PREDICTED: patatin-like phospholipase domain-containing protein 3 [Gekko japonicus]
MLDRKGGWNVSFAGCGFLGVYHIGAASCLQERAPHLIRDAHQIYGASAGALTGAVLLGGGSLAEACADVLRLAKEARKRNLGPLHPSFNVMKIIKDGLCKNLPENTHQLMSGKLCISLTQVSDGKNVLVSNFNSKEEVVQALLCSSFVPIYCGLIPPSFRGVRYVDGGISDNLPHHDSKNTITISPFSGECDICPKGNSANFHEMNLTNTSIQFTSGNMYRLTQALFPPAPQVLGEICEQGYSDALRFLKENGILHDSISVILPLKRGDHAQIPGYTNKKTVAENQGKENLLKEEILIDQLKLASWPLDKAIFDNLPPRLRKALQEACKEKHGLYAQLSKFLPMRLMSYMMLPYTLPVESAYFVALRLVDWFPDILTDVQWMQGQLRQFVGAVYSKARKRLLSFPSNESHILIRKCQTAPLNMGLSSPCRHSKMPHSSAYLKEWFFDLPYCDASAMKEAEADANESFLSIPPFFMNSEESGLELDFDSSSEQSFQTASED